MKIYIIILFIKVVCLQVTIVKRKIQRCNEHLGIIKKTLEKMDMTNSDRKSMKG